MKVPGAEAFFFPPKETGKGVRWGDGRDGGGLGGWGVGKGWGSGG